MLWSVAYRSRERTLTDDEVSRAHASVLAALTARFAIAPR
jgi:phenylalanyl-tRNA synthetase beta subunit